MWSPSSEKKVLVVVCFNVFDETLSLYDLEVMLHCCLDLASSNHQDRNITNIMQLYVYIHIYVHNLNPRYTHVNIEIYIYALTDCCLTPRFYPRCCLRIYINIEIRDLIQLLVLTAPRQYTHLPRLQFYHGLQF